MVQQASKQVRARQSTGHAAQGAQMHCMVVSQTMTPAQASLSEQQNIPSLDRLHIYYQAKEQPAARQGYAVH